MALAAFDNMTFFIIHEALCPQRDAVINLPIAANIACCPDYHASATINNLTLRAFVSSYCS